jgi:Peptidase C13 family
VTEPILPSAAPSAPVAPGLFKGLVRNLRSGLALLTLKRRWPPQFVVSFDQLAALLIVNLAVWTLLDAVHSERDAPLSLDGLFGWACYLLLGLSACALVARVASRATNTRALLVTGLSVAPCVLIIFWLVNDVGLVRAHPYIATTAAVVYLAFLVMRVLGGAFGIVRRGAALVALILVAASPWVVGVLNLDTRLWVADDNTETQSDDDTGQAEALFYDQPARIQQAMARVHPTQRGRTSVYFLGFAGDGDPAVFRREVQFAKEAFGERFGSIERSALLINDVEDRDSYPLASVSGLGQALSVMALRMDPDNDVLVLFLSSHGSVDGLEVQNGSLPLAQLAPADLREALDTAGIRHRVLVVSACYAGVFLDELKTDTTLIITASDAVHSSFGCEDDRDLTWFGEAFLKDALPGSATLESAFAKARELIAQREDAAHENHSNPQLYVGAAMKAKLAEIEAHKPAAEHPAVTVLR